ncbi:uncharacterized protein LOC114945434 isoform X2 [Nylanderia fulva]|uniref:uncharacterized protein LOC114945434 isoform X2 n=1 Tax=Nylanderia fulva TaxID=613905 RepID=UPI0010FB5C21|nr:uncharacterized protein LOC114945434 isoform X2 [Nylanderia fulva]
MEVNNVDEEDENVVIQGSALHVHLSKLGYTDFESVSIPKTTCLEEKEYLNLNTTSTIQKIYTQLFSFYSWIMQEKSISEKQLSTILNAEALLNDHFSAINDFVSKRNDNSKKIRLQELIVAGVVLISSTCISWCEFKVLPTLFASSAICCAGYIKHSRFRANRDLKNVISLQNELLAICKESLKILRRNYRIKFNFEICFQQFSHIMGKKLQYVQSLMETLVSFMGNISHIYYQCSLLIVKLLPPNVLNEELFTKFESNSFEISNKIDYQALKKLYHIYLLVQSEMLYLLAIAYDSNTWIFSHQMIPETKLVHIVRTLIKELTAHKVKLSEIINAYHSCKLEPVRHKAQKAKWQDPTVQLDLASYKLQSGYNQVFSVFKDIDNCISQEIDNETTEILMQKLDKAFKEIDTAKSLMEFVILLTSKSRFSKPKEDQSVTNHTTIDQNLNLPVIMDSEPEILDEVFEEYIKDDYLEPLHEDTDEYTLEQRKLDKLLAKSFMSELKEALVEKHKSMSEREFKALQRLYKNMSKDSASNIEDNNEDCQFIPIPPPMPSNYIWSSNPSDDINSKYERIIPSTCKMKNDDSSIQGKIDDSDSRRVLKYKNTFNTPFKEACETEDRESFLPQILLETQATQFVTKLPPTFLQEETFVGSGENSEDEMIDNSSDEENTSNEENENS